MYVTDVAGIVAGVQMNTLEFHIWGSHTTNLEKPDRIIFDIDPDEGLDFIKVRDAAVEIRDRLSQWGLDSFPMVTGGKGIHVIAPLKPRLEWPDVKLFCKTFAQKLEADAPDRFTSALSQGQAQGADVHRLSAQRTRLDGHRALLDAGAHGCTMCRTGRLGRS